MIDSTRNRNTSFFFSLFYTLSSVLSLYLTFYCIKNPLYLPVASLTLSSMWSITTLITMAHSTSSALVSRLTEMSKTLFLFLLVSDRLRRCAPYRWRYGGRTVRGRLAERATKHAIVHSCLQSTGHFSAVVNVLLSQCCSALLLTLRITARSRERKSLINRCW